MRLMIALCVMTLLPLDGLAQGRITFQVGVTDPSGAKIVGAQVSLQSGGGRVTRERTNSLGVARFRGVEAGTYRILVEAEGFSPLALDDHPVFAQAGRLEVTLEIAPLREEVEVSQDERERQTDPRGDAFTNVLTPEQIDQLPDDPEELEQVLRQMAGPGAVLRIDGFRGGRLPPKSQIQEIRFRMDPYAAENHDPGFGGIDIRTRPGVDSWRGSLSFAFRDESLNARNAFATFRGPEQTRRLAADAGGPLSKGKTSLFLSAQGDNSYDSKTILAALPGSTTLSDLAIRPARSLNLSANLTHALTKTHASRLWYQRNANRRDNLGVGDFDLPDRAYFSDVTDHILRFADSGMIGKKLINEFRFELRWRETALDSISDDPAIVVLNAFSSGGAQVTSNRRVRSFEIADNVDLAFGRHSLRTGILFEGGRYRSAESRNFGGTFVFASLEDFNAARPTTFSRREGDPLVSLNHHQFAWYVQDDFRLRTDLSLSFGIRHEVQSHLRDYSNFAPRFGFAWSPFRSGKTTLRGGFGVFNAWYASDVHEQTLRVDGRRQREIVVRNPGFPDPLLGGNPIVLPPSVLTGDPDLRMPYVAQASLGLQQNLGPGFTATLFYTRQRGYNQLRGRNINAPIAGSGRPDPALGNVTRVESTAESSLDSLRMGMNFMNPARRIFVSVNYLLSRSINESDGPFSLPADNFDLSGERGPSPSDARHRFFAMASMELFKGLRLSTNLRAGSAMPYNITTGFDDNGDTVSNDRPAGVGRNSARGAGHFEVSTRLGWGFGVGGKREQQAASAPTVVVARAGGDQGGFMGVSSEKRIGVELYLQAFNLFNRVNPMSFSGVQTSPFFGQPIAALPGRRLETGLRLSF